MAWKYLMSLALVLLISLTIARAEGDEDDQEMYTSKYDDIDVDAILANDKLRNQYINCYLEKGPCVTADAKYLKEKFAEAFMTNCKKCTPKQVEIFNKVSAWFTENDPETWKLAVEKALEDVKKLSDQ